MNIFVAKLNFRTSQESLEQLFSQFGEVESVKIITDKETGKSKGYGFVQMASEDAGLAAVASLNEQEFEGQVIVVKQAEDRPAGGGFQKREFKPRDGGFKPRDGGFKPRGEFKPRDGYKPRDY
jgi:RNA recognition motif-containing protein